MKKRDQQKSKPKKRDQEVPFLILCVVVYFMCSLRSVRCGRRRPEWRSQWWLRGEQASERCAGACESTQWPR